MRTVMVALTAALMLTAGAGAQESMLKRAPADTSQPRQRLVTVFGTDACPKSSDPNEIVVCTRRPDEERYRLPPAVRTADGKPQSPFSKNRKLLLGDSTGGAGGGIGSCSAVGPGGASGCQYKANEAWGGVPR